MFANIVSQYTKKTLHIISCAGSGMFQRDPIPETVMSSPFTRLDVRYDSMQCFSSESPDVAQISVEHEMYNTVSNIVGAIL